MAEYFKPELNQEYTIRVASLDRESLEWTTSFYENGQKLKLLADVKGQSNGMIWAVTPVQLDVLCDRGVVPGEPFSYKVWKDGGKWKYYVKTLQESSKPSVSEAPRVTWDELEGETDLTRALRESTAMVQQRQAVPSVVPMPARPAAPTGATVHTLASQALAGCLIASVDACASAEAYAKKKGIDFHATPEVVQDLASTLFINLSKMGGGLQAMAPNPDQQQLVNGGTKWAQ